jgi:hypothetical protein
LAVLKPIRVKLAAGGNFNFPQERIYEEGDAEVGWPLLFIWIATISTLITKHGSYPRWAR